MTVSTQENIVKYQGNPSTTVYQIPFRWLEDTDINIKKQLQDGTVEVLTYLTDYTLTGENDEHGGYATFTVAPLETDTIVIQRIVPYTQETDYEENEIFPADSHEEALDKLTMEVQQLAEESSRSLKISVFSTVDLDSVINEIERVYDSTDNIDIVANNINDVNTVADNIANVNTVGGDIDSVVTTATNINDVKTVAQNKASLNITAANINDIKTVSSIKDDVPTVADNSANITTVGTNISAVNTAAANIEAIQNAPNQAISAQNSATQAAQSAQTAEDKADEASESARQALSALSLQIGDVCFVPLGIDESLNLRRYLNGQVLIQSQFVAFTNKVKSAIALYPNLATTEANWQAEKTNSKLGQCGKFVVDDDAGTIRLPCVVNAQGLVDLASIGSIKSESLPNINGSVVASTSTQGILLNNLTGAFFNKTGKTKGTFNAGVSGANFIDTLGFNASRSSSTYQDNAPVQQEAIQYPYCIVVNVGVEEPDRPINNYQVNNVYSYGMSQYYKGTMNNNSWLKSAGQWNDGTVYTGMYNWLLEQMNAGVDGFKGTVGYAWKSQTADIRFWTAIRNPSVGCAVYGGFGISFVGTVTSINPDGTLSFYEVSTGINYENLVYTESENINNEGTAFGNLKFANDYDFLINTTDQTFRLPLLNGSEDWVGNETSVLSTADIVKDSPFQWTATKNGFVKFTCYKPNTTQVVIARINGQTLIYSGVATTTTTPRPGFWLKVRKGDTISISAETQTLSSVSITFIPAVGNGSLYYYIGDTLQNAQLINVARIEETLVNKTNKVQAAEASMPSNKYIDLTLGATGATYTAPANGWFTINKHSTPGKLAAFENESAGRVTWIVQISAETDCRVSCPARTGDIVRLWYSADGNLNFFRFIYAEGNQ